MELRARGQLAMQVGRSGEDTQRSIGKRGFCKRIYRFVDEFELEMNFKGYKLEHDGIF